MAHALVHARGFELPRVRSSELYADQNFTQAISDLSQAQTGDLIGLTRPDKQDFRGIHVGVLLVNSNGVNIVHNARHVGRAVVQSLDEARQYPHHSKVAWIKRPIVTNPALARPDALRAVGLEELAA